MEVRREDFLMVYERRVNYYETDGMGIVHHSNYIRYLEEARLYFLDAMGLPYHKIEEEKLMIPVLGVNCTYHYPARFDDVLIISPKITEFNGVRMTVFYRITEKKTGNLVLEGETKHCFTDCHLKPVSLKKVKPEMYEIFSSAL